MSGRIYAAFFVFLIISMLPAAVLFPAQYGNSLSWEPVDGAGGYIIEIRDSQKKMIVEKEIDVTHFDISRLAPGHYQYRLTTLNKLSRRGNNTGWINFQVEKAVIPVIKSISGKVLYNTSDNSPLTVSGENFLYDTKLYLKKGNETVELNTRFISENVLTAYYRPDKKISGIYKLVAVNSGGFESAARLEIEVITATDIVFRDKVEGKISTEITKAGEKVENKTSTETARVRESETAKNVTVKEDSTKTKTSSCSFPDLTNLAFGAGWDVALPVGSWSTKLDPSLAGFSLFISYPLAEFSAFKNIRFMKNFGIEAVFNYADYSFTDGTGQESFSRSGGYAGINYVVTPGMFPSAVSLLFNLDAGTAYTSMTVLSYKKPVDHKSIDFAMKCGMSIRYKWFRHFFTDLSAGYDRIFFVSHPLDEVTVSLKAGVLF